MKKFVFFALCCLSVAAFAVDFSKAESPRVRSLENFMAATKSRDFGERKALLLEALKDDPDSRTGMEFLESMIQTRTEAREIAPAVRDLAAANPGNLLLGTMAARMCYGGNYPVPEYIGFVRSLLAGVKNPDKLAPELLDNYYVLVSVYTSALRQVGSYAEGSEYLASIRKKTSGDVLFQLFNSSLEYEYFFSRYGNRERGFLGLGKSDREKAQACFDDLFSEYANLIPALEGAELERAIDVCASVGKADVALDAAERGRGKDVNPAADVRIAYLAVAAKDYDKAAEIAEKISKLDGWKGPSQILLINSFIAQKKFAEAKAKAEEIRVPIARDEFLLRIYEAEKNFTGMRTLLDDMEKRLSPDVKIDLANALRQVAVAEYLKDADLLNRIWKLMVETDQIDSPDAANAVGYVAAELNIRLDEAEKLIRGAIEAEPYNAAYLDSMAWVLFRQGKAEEALQWIEKSVRESEQDADRGIMFEHKGDILKALGKKSEALKSYRQALECSESLDFDPVRVEKKIADLK